MKSDITNEIDGIEKYEEKLKINKVSQEILYLPKENSLRTLIKYQKLEKTSTNYPRRYNEIKKKSL